MTAHAKKPDFVFRRNGRVHLNRRARQFSRLLAAEVCVSAVVMLDTPCSEVVWGVLATHCIRMFPLHFHSPASPCAITFQLESTAGSFLGIMWPARDAAQFNIRKCGVCQISVRMYSVRMEINVTCWNSLPDGIKPERELRADFGVELIGDGDRPCNLNAGTHKIRTKISAFHVAI